MEEYSITLKPVFSRCVAELPPAVKLPQGWSALSWHQLETFNALKNPNVDVVFNTAITGDGKSLAAYLPSMTGKNYTLAMYPTNELARDQERQVQDYKEKFKPECDPQIYRLTGAILEDFVATNQLASKQQGIIDRVDNSEILLTNPDIFHYIHDFRYLRRNLKNLSKGDNADKLFRKIDDAYKLFVFDEFHIFSSPQVASILNAMLLIKHTAIKRKFLFLSATPSELLLGFLQRAGFSTQVIDPVAQSAYQFSVTAQSDWRQISQLITLNFPLDLQPNAQASYEWIIENTESKILDFFLTHPGSKGAIILNSIASVYRLLGHLKPLFAQQGLTVLPNTSLTGEHERAKSIAEADLLLGTSTIDVGVDFKINFLIFEAADAGNFIQRFGRLGRHLGFSAYQAYALIPNFLVAKLFNSKGEESAPLTAESPYDRVTFSQIVRDAWSFVNQFETYPQRWGSVQSVCMHMELRGKHMADTYPDAQHGFRTDVERAFQVNLGNKYGEVKGYLDQKLHKIIDEARSFRGSSELNCAIYDETNPAEPERDRFKTYHLPGLLSNFVFDSIAKEDFLQRVKAAKLPSRRFEEALCYLSLRNYREVRENWHFHYAGDDFEDVKRLRSVQVLKGLEVTAGLNAMSRSLSRRGLVCFVADYDRAYLRAKLGLPMQFQAYGLSNRMDDQNPPYTIAFGQSALMLETLIRYWKPKENKAWIF
jgi:CRISPR-associated endonuclease/helicase Cas3